MRFFRYIKALWEKYRQRLPKVNRGDRSLIGLPIGGLSPD